MRERTMTLAETHPEERHTGTRGGPAAVLDPSLSPVVLDEGFRALAGDAAYGALQRALVRCFAPSDAEAWADLVRGRAPAAHPSAVRVP